jgi:hypothetical protein
VPLGSENPPSHFCLHSRQLPAGSRDQSNLTALKGFYESIVLGSLISCSKLSDYGVTTHQWRLNLWQWSIEPLSVIVASKIKRLWLRGANTSIHPIDCLLVSSLIAPRHLITHVFSSLLPLATNPVETIQQPAQSRMHRLNERWNDASSVWQGFRKTRGFPTGSGRVRVRCRPWEKPQKPRPLGKNPRVEYF